MLLYIGCTREKQEPRVVALDPQEAVEKNRKIEQQVTSSELAEGFEIRLWASEQLMGDPVGLDIDNRGRAFIAVTHRSTDSEFDIRGHRDWIPYSMTWTTVEERRNFLHREFATEKSDENKDVLPDYNQDGSHDWRDLTVLQEEVYVVEDSSGDGVADRSHRYYRGFDTSEVTDVLGTVLYDERSGHLFAAVAPDVWRLEDRNGDGMADFRESISHGYAVHIGFSGHGMSGLTVGPDGKIYWGIGDIGSNVTDKEGRRWANPNRGIIARANPDGSDFEIFAHGVRNTHEFAFDRYGNLISVDNDGDHAGESERIVHLIHGSDSGWRTNWQFGKYSDPKNNEYKVWMDEAYFKPRHEGQTAHILPPVALYHSGPSGMAYNPGTALSEEWTGYFFMTEFVGSPRSAVHAFKLKRNGASYALEDSRVIQRGILGTSLDFGPDGALYVSDWIEGWDRTGEGRIWRLDTPATAESEIRRETQELLGETFSDRTGEELFRLLQHRDMRVRQKAQFELANRGESGFQILVRATRQTGSQLARIHGIWGIGQLVRSDRTYAEPLAGLLTDGDPEIRAQAAKVIGEEGYDAATQELISLLEDEEPRPRMYAAEALGKLQYRPAVQPILDMLEQNGGEDAYLRQAGAIALSRIGDTEPLVALHNSPSRARRMAAVIALKRIGDPGVSRFLHDEDRYIVTDAARAIGDDKFIDEALPELAALLEEPGIGYEPLIRRVINAGLYVGTEEAADRIARYALRTDAPEDMRVEAIRTLGVWPNPSKFDRVTGRYRGVIEREGSILREAVKPLIDRLITDEMASVRSATADLVGALSLTEQAAALSERLENDPSPEVRISSLNALYEMEYDAIDRVIGAALDDSETQVRMAALEMIPTLAVSGEVQAGLLRSVMDEGSLEEQQIALATLGRMQHTEANEVLEDQVGRLMQGNIADEIKLDLIQAVERSGSGRLAARLEQYQEDKSDEGITARYSELLYGGDAERGRSIFYRNDAAQCTRCHVIDDYGVEVGPPLTHIGSILSREQILESLVDPGSRIAPGYGTVVLTLDSGESIRGVVRRETGSTMTVMTGEGEAVKVQIDQIQNRQNAPSSMPPMGTLLTRRELRDLVEFLSSLK